MDDTNDKPVVNFAILQSVEDYINSSGKFRTQCAWFRIPSQDSGNANTIYIPYCDKQRFDFGNTLDDYRGGGVFSPPETGKRWQLTDFILFRDHFHGIHCPRPCRGYRNKKLVALLNKIWRRPSRAQKWTRKEIVATMLVPLVIGLVCALLGWLTPEGRHFLHLDKAPSDQQTSKTIESLGAPGHPVIKISRTSVSYRPDSREVQVSTTFANLSDSEVEARLQLHLLWGGPTYPGWESMPKDTAVEREIAMGPKPDSFTLNTSCILPPEAAQQYFNEKALVMVGASAEYTDQRAGMEYEFAGNARVQSNTVDVVTDHWFKRP